MLPCNVGLLAGGGTWEGISIRHPHIPRPWNPIRAPRENVLPELGRRLANSIPPFFETTPLSHNAQYDLFGLHCRGGVLTAGRVRDIRFSSSWRPSSIENGHGTTRPESLASITLSGQNGLNKSNIREKI